MMKEKSIVDITISTYLYCILSLTAKNEGFVVFKEKDGLKIKW